MVIHALPLTWGYRRGVTAGLAAGPPFIILASLPDIHGVLTDINVTVSGSYGGGASAPFNFKMDGLLPLLVTSSVGGGRFMAVYTLTLLGTHRVTVEWAANTAVKDSDTFVTFLL